MKWKKKKKVLKLEISMKQITLLKSLAILGMESNFKRISKENKFIAAKGIMEIDKAVHNQDFCDAVVCQYKNQLIVFKEAFKDLIEEAEKNGETFPDLEGLPSIESVPDLKKRFKIGGTITGDDVKELVKGIKDVFEEMSKNFAKNDNPDEKKELKSNVYLNTPKTVIKKPKAIKKDPKVTISGKEFEFKVIYNALNDQDSESIKIGDGKYKRSNVEEALLMALKRK